MNILQKEVKSRHAQFYLISAVVIILIVISIVSIRNNISTKKTPQNFYDMTDILKLEGKYVIENAEFKSKNVQESTEDYLYLFSQYLQEHTNEDFNLIILYGDVNGESINGRVYSKASTGGVGLNLGGRQIDITSGETIKTENTTVTINSANAAKKTVNITISAGGAVVTQELPVLEDNNFLFVMTTNEGFNNYVQSSTNPQ